MDEEYSDEMGANDFIDVEAEYVSTDTANAELSTSTDFDYSQNLPEEPAVPFDAPMSDTQLEYMTELDQEAAPTRTIGVAQDVLNLTKEIASGDERDAAAALSAFSNKQLARFTSPKVIGPLLLFYAYRGRFGMVERTIIAAIGAGAAISGYGMLKKNQGAVSLDHPLMKTVKQRLL